MITTNTAPAAATTSDDIFDVPFDSLGNNTGSSDNSAWKAEAGIHQATCVAIADLGEQEIEWKGTVKKQRKIQLLFALADQEHPELGEPLTVIGKRYTASLFEQSALAKDLKAWGVKPTKLIELIGAKAQLIIVVTEEGYVNIQGIAPAGKNQADPAKPVYVPKFWIEKDGEPTGYRLITHPTLVTAGLRPKDESSEG